MFRRRPSGSAARGPTLSSYSTVDEVRAESLEAPLDKSTIPGANAAPAVAPCRRKSRRETSAGDGLLSAAESLTAIACVSRSLVKRAVFRKMPPSNSITTVDRKWPRFRPTCSSSADGTKFRGGAILMRHEEQARIHERGTEILPSAVGLARLFAHFLERLAIDLRRRHLGVLQLAVGAKSPHDGFGRSVRLAGRQVNHRHREAGQAVETIGVDPDVGLAAVPHVTGALGHVLLAAHAVPALRNDAVEVVLFAKIKAFDQVLARNAVGVERAAGHEELIGTTNPPQVVDVGHRRQRPVLGDVPLAAGIEEQTQQRQARADLLAQGQSGRVGGVGVE